MLRRIGTSKIIIGALAVIVLLGGFLYFYVSPPALFKRQQLKEEALPPTGSRILVFAPHCDDETLGTGILINRALKAGIKVRVVLVTNGDGFRLAVDEEFITLHPNNKEFREFGKQRQRESLAALKLLGVAEKDVIFLGYPDEGVAHMWNESWDPDKRFFSRYTQTNISPYKDSYDKKAPYTGVSLLNDIKRVIRDFKPTHIYYPHPNDQHPDHWGVNAFVKYVLEEEHLSNIKERLYLVHRGNWPKPKLPLPGKSLLPPEQLQHEGTKWREFGFKPGESRLKHEAILKYKTQVRAMGPFLAAFVRSNELFGQYSDFTLLQKGKASAGYGKGEVGSDRDLAIADPSGDFVTGDIDKAADITGIYSYVRDDRWVLELAAKQPIKRDIAYRVHARLFPDKGDGRRFDLEYRQGRVALKSYATNSLKDIPGLRAEEVQGRLRIIIPRSTVNGLKAAFISADCSVGHYRADKTAWRMLRF